jgi:hypothetical protein
MKRNTLDLLFLCTLGVLTWEKIRWETPAVSLTITNIFALGFVVVFLVDRIRRRDAAVPAACLTLAGFMAVFAAVYLAGYFDLQNREALSFWAKGLGSWTVHFAFLICGVAHLSRRGRELFVEGWKWFTGGLLLNCVYGLVQLVVQVGAGINLDKVVVGPLTAGQGGVGGINVYGQVSGSQSIYRVNALTGDPNHLGVMLCVPLLLFLPVYLRAPRERKRMGWILLFMFGVQVLTLSRSGALGDFVGLIVLLPVLRHRLPRVRSVVLVLSPLIVAFAVLYASSHFIRKVIETRISTGGSGTQTHLQFYQLVPPALNPNPLFGMGFNTFAVFYEFITGRSDFGPHSIWIATLVETGIVGLAVYLAYFFYLVACALAIRKATDPDIRAAGWGTTAALIGTAAANFFYLTMSFDYFFALAVLTVGGMVLFSRARVAYSPALTTLGVRRT